MFERAQLQLKLIDFGSACDVKGLLRPGSRFRSLDPLYSPPEVRGSRVQEQQGEGGEEKGRRTK
eukprot:763946-Hanusia_phi.AAC.3